MTRWNHFAPIKYARINFSELKIGDRFRNDFWHRGRRRADIICIKTGELSYIEQRSKREHTLFSVSNYTVYSYDRASTQNQSTEAEGLS